MHHILKGKRILLADDHDFVREGVPTILRQEGIRVHVFIGHEGIGIYQPDNDRLFLHMYDSGPKVQQTLTTYPTAFDAVIMDLQGMDGEEEFRPEKEIPLLMQQYSRIPFIIFSVESCFARQYIEAGARGYVVKDDQTNHLLKALETVLVQEDIYISPKVRQDVWELITLQERELLQLAAQGYNQREIAADMDVNLDRVENLVRRIRAKLDADNITHAVAIALRQGLIQ